MRELKHQKAASELENTEARASKALESIGTILERTQSEGQEVDTDSLRADLASIVEKYEARVSQITQQTGDAPTPDENRPDPTSNVQQVHARLDGQQLYEESPHFTDGSIQLTESAKDTLNGMTADERLLLATDYLHDVSHKLWVAGRTEEAEAVYFATDALRLDALSSDIVLGNDPLPNSKLRTQGKHAVTGTMRSHGPPRNP